MSSLQIAGGTYVEICHFPHWQQLYGSGGRAAGAVANLCRVQLHTCIGTRDRSDLEALAGAFGFDLKITEQPTTVTFEYFHGLSVPRILPALLAIPQRTVELEAEAVLRFGMVEAKCVVHGRRVVYDPQSPASPEPFEINGSTAEALCVVLNRGEGRALTGADDAEEIARRLLSAPGMEAVVVKQGADGALVATCNGQVEIVPAYETPYVFPIGSGDVFSAAFAARWAVYKDDPMAAARFASLAVAHYCATKSLPVPMSKAEIKQALPGLRSLSPVSSTSPPACYLAGPFFTMSQRWLIEEALNALRSQGLKVFSPYHEIGIGMAKDVVPADLAAIKRSNVMFAIVDGLDAGTLFEIGYARSRGIPVVAFAEREGGQDLKLLEGSGCRIEKDFTTAIYRTNWVGYGR